MDTHDAADSAGRSDSKELGDLKPLLDKALKKAKSRLFEQIKFDKMSADELDKGGNYDRSAHDRASGHDKGIG